MPRDFRTPKPDVLSSSSAKSWNTKVHEITLSMDDDGTGNDTSTISCGSQSVPIALTDSHKSQVTLLKPSFSRSKPAEKSRRYSSGQSDACSSIKSSHPSLPNSSGKNFPQASCVNPVNSSNASLLKPNIQVVKNPKRKHAEFLENSCQGKIEEVQQEDCSKNTNLDARRKSKDYIRDVQEERKALREVENYVPSTKGLKTKSKSVVDKDQIIALAKMSKQAVDKNELPVVTKPKATQEFLNNEFVKKVIDDQKYEVTKKVIKVKTKPVTKDLSTSTTKAKTKPDVVNDELIAKVIDHYKRGELRLLTVADLKYFLSAKKAKVGGTKEVLIQRATELFS